MTTEGLAKRTRDPLESPAQDQDDYSKEKKAVTAAADQKKGLATTADHKKAIQSLVLAVALPLIVGSVVAYLNNPNQPFYKELKKPYWIPPNWLFVMAWSILYPTMGLASWLVWVEGGWNRQAYALGLYLTQLALNLLWPMVFFGLHSIGLALIDIAALNVALAACISAFKPVNHVAFNLMKLYLAWVVFATALNFSLWMMNSTLGHPIKQ